MTEGAHACAINSFGIGFEPSFHHGLRGVTVGHAHALAKAVIERIVQVKDHAADERLGRASHSPLLTAWWRDDYFLLSSFF